jgi:hypothetical protein
LARYLVPLAKPLSQSCPTSAWRLRVNLVNPFANLWRGQLLYHYLHKKRREFSHTSIMMV